jgi:hypothetical protein
MTLSTRKLFFQATMTLAVFCGTSRAQLTVTDVSPDAAFATVLENGNSPSGRVDGIVIDPTNDSILYAATEWVGVWKSVDGGRTWNPSSQGLRSGITQELLGAPNPGRPILAIDVANPARLLYATEPVDGRVPFPCSSDPATQCNFGGLWISVDAAATWKHVEFPNCQSGSTGLKSPIGFNIAGVGFAAGIAFVMTENQSCRLFASTDPSLLTWSLSPAPPFQVGDVTVAMGLTPLTSPAGVTLFACQGLVAYRKLNATSQAPAWKPVKLPAPCEGIAARPSDSAIQNGALVVVQGGAGTTLAGGEFALQVDFDSGAVNQIGGAFSTMTGSGIFGVWAPPRPTNPNGAPGPGASFDVFAADSLNFYEFTPNGWLQLPGIHVDTWSMAFPSSYDPANNSCEAFAATDGGVAVGAGSPLPPGCNYLGLWTLASSGLHVLWGQTMSAVQQLPDNITSCVSPCGPSFFLPTADNDTWHAYYNGYNAGPQIIWEQFPDGLGDSGWVVTDPGQADLALATRNSPWSLFSGKGLDRSVSPGDPKTTFIPYCCWTGTTAPAFSGLSPVLTPLSEQPNGPLDTASALWGGDILGIVSTYRSNMNCQGKNPVLSCSSDAIGRNTALTVPALASVGWLGLDISNGFFGPGVIGGIYASGGHKNLTVYVLTANDSSIPGQIWKGQSVNGGIIINWQRVGKESVVQAYNLIVNPYDPSELYITDLGDPVGPTIKTSRDGGQSWSRMPDLNGIATNHGEFDFDCGSFVFGTVYQDKQIFGNQCPLQGVVFRRENPEFRVAVLYPGGVAFSRDSGMHWIPLNFTHADPSQQPILPPMSAYYSANYDPSPTVNPDRLSSLYVALEGRGIWRIDGPFSTLTGVSVVFACPTCSTPGPAASNVSVMVSPLGTTLQLYLGADGLCHGTILVDSAKTSSLNLTFLVNGAAVQTLTHTLTAAEMANGVAAVANTQPQSYYFAHIAVGDVWRTTFTLVNASNQPVTCNTSFYSDSGSPLPLSFGGSLKSSTSDIIPAGGLARRQTDAQSAAPLLTGWARADCSGPVKASALFRSYSSAAPQAEASVIAMTAPATAFVTYANQLTGVAYANPGNSPATIAFTARDSTGTVLGTKTITVGAGSHGATNIGPLLGLSVFEGSITINSSQPIISLSINAEAWPVFSSLPLGNDD